MPTTPQTTKIHATCVARHTPHGMCAVVLRGPSGSGKSDMALRMIQEEGAILVADDWVELAQTTRGLLASPPAPLEGLLEVRGLGLVKQPFLTGVPVKLIVDLVDREDMPRLPESDFETIMESKLPKMKISSFDFTSPLKICWALDCLPERGFPKEDGIFR